MVVSVPLIGSIIISDFTDLLYDCLTSKKPSLLSPQSLLSLALAVVSVILISIFDYSLFEIDDSRLSNYFNTLTNQAQFS